MGRYKATGNPETINIDGKVYKKAPKNSPRPTTGEITRIASGAMGSRPGHGVYVTLADGVYHPGLPEDHPARKKEKKI